ncbi:hypothetical protein CDSM653_00414 [Caldanaerobacter subterraneus subsp. pacificus DSM 12653]|nr:hypothetical protein CDSM653_00414 [Caldanaerobacter subterraneus subsp. pacificus DSM 12653]
MEVELPEWKVVDFHCHFPSGEEELFEAYKKEYIQKFGKEKWDFLQYTSLQENKKWLNAWCFPEPQKQMENFEALLERWYTEINANNLEKVVFVTCRNNEEAIKITKLYPEKFLAFAHHSPEEENAADKLEEAIKNGLKGYKIMGPLVKIPLNHKRFYRIWEVATEYQIPVLIHFGILGGGGGIGYSPNIDPLIIHDVAKAFPKLKIVIPHFGCGYVRELLQLAWACPNIYVDTSGNNEWIRWMPYELTLEGLFKKFYETIGPERIIYGSDSEWFPRGYVIRYFLDQIRAVRRIGIPEGDIKKIFRDNALNLLKE